MSARITAAMPVWADNPRGRDLLDQIIANPPRTYTRSADDWRHDAEQVFTSHGCPALAALRRMHSEWEDRQFAALDAQFHITGKWDDDASRSIHLTETADQLVSRMLADEQLTERAGDPMLNKRRAA